MCAMYHHGWGYVGTRDDGDGSCRCGQPLPVSTDPQTNLKEHVKVR